MKAKVGDKVRITGNTSGSCNKIGDAGVITELQRRECRVQVDGKSNIGNWSYLSDIELIPTDDTISAQIKARMDEHMSNGEYVRAVKWAQVLEMVEGLENE